MRRKKPDYTIAILIGILVLFGLVMLASASSHLGKTRFDDTYHYLKSQILHGVLIGLVGFFIASKISYQTLRKLSPLLLLGNIALLGLVFTPLGVQAGGAERWLALGPMTFQPAELLKITFIVYLAAWLSGNSERAKSVKKGVVPFVVVLGAVSALLLKQPATSVVILLGAVAGIVYFASGARWSHVIGTAICAAVAIGLVIYATPYRLNRITSFLNPEADALGSGYHLTQARIAIGSGGLFGVGYGQSTTKINFLPEPIGDSIFAVIGEEVGFAGSMVLIALFFLLVMKILLVAKKTQDRFGKLLLIGFAAIIGLQAFLNIGAISGLLPLTGTSLPFISFGGTALAVFMTIGGIVTNISKRG